MTGLKKLLIAFVGILFLNACDQNQPVVEERVVVEREYVEQNIPVQARPRPVELQDVKWYVVNEDNLEEFKERFKNENGRLVFAAVSIDDYEVLSLNVAELERFINQQKDVIVYYERFAR